MNINLKNFIGKKKFIFKNLNKKQTDFKEKTRAWFKVRNC